jgi:hypothetical protein
LNRREYNLRHLLAQTASAAWPSLENDEDGFVSGWYGVLFGVFDAKNQNVVSTNGYS